MTGNRTVQKPMALYKVKEGLEVSIDMNNVTIKEWRSLFDNSHTFEEDDAIVSKITGLSIDTLANLTQPEYRRLFHAIVEASKQTDPF